MKKKDIKKAVRKSYANIAGQGSCCDPAQSCSDNTDTVQMKSKQMGYSEQEINAVPEGANLGLGCGNPVAIASLKNGETVLDLGSGAGFDCFLAAKKVGKNGKVIGVDMTPEMIEKARENAEKGNYNNVEFRLGEIEHLPAADNSIDAVISNCVVNLSPDKEQVIKEAYRVLKPGGRIAISDLVLLRELPEKIRNSIEAYVGCVAGAIPIEQYKTIVKATGFKDVKVTTRGGCCSDEPDTEKAAEESLSGLPQDIKSLAGYIVSAYIEGIK